MWYHKYHDVDFFTKEWTWWDVENNYFTSSYRKIAKLMRMTEEEYRLFPKRSYRKRPPKGTPEQEELYHFFQTVIKEEIDNQIIEEMRERHAT